MAETETDGCACCGRNVETPYHHDNHNPPYDGYDYCQACYDEGCDGPGGCSLPQNYAEEAPMSTELNDVERAEMMLSLGMNDEGNPLSAEERATLEQFVAGARPQQTPQQAQAQPAVQAGGENDLQALIAAEVAKVASQLGTGVAQPQQTAFEDVLKQIDPRDSEAALAMFHWLADNQRFQVIGTLNGGGYLMHYQEPKGSSKEGYIPGGTKGGRMVDEAVKQAQAAGAKPRKTGMCDKCWSAVERLDNGTVVLDGSTDPNGAVCSQGGQHTFNA